MKKHFRSEYCFEVADLRLKYFSHEHNGLTFDVVDKGEICFVNWISNIPTKG